MIFTPRPCQVPIIEQMAKLNRANIFASPGTGKTASTLAALSSLDVVDGDVFPALVVAPKRVANQVWDAEVQEWASFHHLRVSKILGNVAEREAALYAKADIYTINPANLTWLDAMVGKDWPFVTVVADESTVLKGHRCSFRKTPSGKWALYVIGGKRARDLVKHAPKVKRWYNLTGTPTPNGLIDLWGQQWPVDFGKALGDTYSAYLQTWFRQKFGSSAEQRRYELMPGCDDVILRRMAPTSVTIDAYDWFDIQKPVVRDIKFELPAKARELYKRIHEQSVEEVLKSDTLITAVNTGAAVMKCRQIASGNVRQDDGEWRQVHDEKLEALTELVDELDGQPLLVAYWFKEDAKAIMRKFPKAVMLPSDKTQGQVQADWNAGKIQMLLVQPQSAGHGLSLQHGGNNLCFYTVDWNAEYYEQVIERLGPTRQAQSGYKRMVYVHRLLAANTWDITISRVLSGKLSLSEAVKDALAFRF